MRSTPLWRVAERIARWRRAQGYDAYFGLLARTDWVGDTIWSDGGALPSGDRFRIWIDCEL